MLSIFSPGEFESIRATRMLARSPQVQGVIVPRVGHAPMLDEPEAAAAIDRLLAKIA